MSIWERRIYGVSRLALLRAVGPDLASVGRSRYPTVFATMNPNRLFPRLSDGHLQNVSFSDMCRLVLKWLRPGMHGCMLPGQKASRFHHRLIARQSTRTVFVASVLQCSQLERQLASTPYCSPEHSVPSRTQNVVPGIACCVPLSSDSTQPPSTVCTSCTLHVMQSAVQCVITACWSAVQPAGPAGGGGPAVCAQPN